MFYKKVDKQSNKEMFNFLHNHFEYYTLNCWNGLRSIANNVKVYNLPVDSSDALQALEEDDCCTINMCIEDFEENHPGYKVGFNGRSAGYLVLYNTQNNSHALDSYSPCQYDSYEDWKKDVQEVYGSLKAYHSILKADVELVQDFDALCDELIEVLKELIKEMHHRHEHTVEWHAIRRHEHYVYDTLTDLYRHKQYMLQQGARIFDENDDDLYVEYEVDKNYEGTVILEYDEEKLYE